MIKWNKVNYSDEKTEFERTTKYFTEPTVNNYSKHLEQNNRELKKAYEKSKIEKLTDSIWRQLRNTDSYKIKSIEDIFTAMKHNNEQRDIGKIFDEIVSEKVRAPIVLKTSSEYYLIGGNTRLMVAKMLKIQPSVVMVHIDW